MNTLLATLTIVALSICSTDKYSIKEDRTIEKSTNTQKEKYKSRLSSKRFLPNG